MGLAINQTKYGFIKVVKSGLHGSGVKMYLTSNDGKSAVAETFIRTLKNKIYKHMTAIPKNVYIDKLDEMVSKYSKTYHRTIKMKPAEVKPDTNFEYDLYIMTKILNSEL